MSSPRVPSKERTTTDRRSNLAAILIAVIVAFLYVSGLPGALLVDIDVADIDPVSITLFINILFSMAIGLALIRIVIPGFEVGFTSQKFTSGLRKYGLSGVFAFLVPFVAVIIGLTPFDHTPTVWKVLFEGIIYFIAVGIIEEFFCRGLLQNGIAGLLDTRSNPQLLAVLITATVFGLGHIVALTGEPGWLAASRLLWAIALGVYFGAIYVLTGNLWLVALFHFVVNLSGLPFNFSTQDSYPAISTVIVLTTYLGLAMYGIHLIRQRDEARGNLNWSNV